MEIRETGKTSSSPLPEGAMPTTVFRFKQQHALHAFFAPKSVAIIGASEKVGSVGRALLWNLLKHPFGGTVFPINAKHSSVLGIKAYANLADLPQPVDLAVIATPAPTVPDIITECVATGVKGAIIISAGFKESGEVGVRLEQQVLEQARQGNLHLLGPNCLGLMHPLTGLNATFANDIALPGHVAFLSQSGALCTAVLDWSLRAHVGFSVFVSLGSMADIGWGDLIDYLGSDQQTSSIILYMETVGDARSLLSAAREVARRKPIIILKAGRTQAAAQAAASHTGALTGSHTVFEAACSRCGALQVDRIDELFFLAEVLAKQPPPQGPRLTILTNAGGPGVLAADALMSAGGALAPLSSSTLAALDQILPTAWSRGNPVDILGDADPQRYASALEIAARDPNSDGLLVILTPQAMTDPTLTAEQIKRVAPSLKKTIIASWMGGAEVESGTAILNRASIPTFSYPDTAAQMFEYMWRYTAHLRSIYETPSFSLESDNSGPDRTLATSCMETALQSGRTLLTEFESKQLLTAYGIPTVETRIATTEAEAIQQAEEIGYPVVLKLHSETITHKTDVGGIRLHLSNADAVREAYQAIEETVREKAGPGHFLGVTVQPMIPSDGYELILGSSLDPQFGPVLLFGSGGQLVEVYRDQALALPPLTTTLARRMIEQTRVFQALQGIRGRSAIDLAALERLLVRFSSLIAEQPRIREIDINPLFASPQRLLALDARVVLHPSDISDDELPRLAIRPYPRQYVSLWETRDGLAVTVRPIRPEDEPLMVRFHQTLSDRSVYFRWLHMLGLSQRIAHERLIDICFIDYDRQMALVADAHNSQTGQDEIFGVGRLIKASEANEAEFAILVADPFQRKGIGTELLRRLIQVGQDEHLQRLTGDILIENTGMQKVCTNLGFHLQYSPEEQVVKAELDLDGAKDTR